MQNPDARPTLEAPDDDPYLWLEEIEGERALAFVQLQNAATLQRFGNARFAADRDALGNAGADIIPKPNVPHDRIAAEQRTRIGPFDPGDDVEQHRAGLGFAQIARQHRVAARQHAQFGNPFEESGDLARRNGIAAPPLVARMV